MTDALIVDLDGVLLLRDAAHRESLERAAGLPAGTLLEFAFTGEAFTAALTGQATDADWRADIAERIGIVFGRSGREAVARWSNSPAVVDEQVLDLVRTQRARRPVDLLTNSTDRLPQELAALGLDREFDAVFNSAELGVAKPDPAVYRRVSDVLQTENLAYVDDSRTNVDAAGAFGWHTHHYRDAARLQTFLSTLPRRDAP